MNGNTASMNLNCVYTLGISDNDMKFVEMEQLALRKEELKKRSIMHIDERYKGLQTCAFKTITELTTNHNINIKQSQFTIKKSIFNDTIAHMFDQIDDWEGVKIKRCKKQSHHSNTKYEAYNNRTRAKNWHDSNSWKITGQYLFAPVINQFYDYVNAAITDCDDIVSFCVICFVKHICNFRIRFSHSPKSRLLRARTLTDSAELHKCLHRIACKTLGRIEQFVAIEQVKANKNKQRCIKAEQFQDDFSEYCRCVLDKNVRRRHIVTKNDNTYEFPEDWAFVNNEKEVKIGKKSQRSKPSPVLAMAMAIIDDDDMKHDIMDVDGDGDNVTYPVIALSPSPAYMDHMRFEQIFEIRNLNNALNRRFSNFNGCGNGVSYNV